MFICVGVRKLESSLLKFYLVNAVTNNKNDKVVDFFTKMTPEIQSLPEWKEWFSKFKPKSNMYNNFYWQRKFLFSFFNA